MSSPTNTFVFGDPIRAGSLSVRLAQSNDMPAVLALRTKAFRGDAATSDEDALDADYQHLWVGTDNNEVIATVRFKRHQTASELLSGYAAQHYDLAKLARAGGQFLELGRLCTDQNAIDADALRLLWAGVARIVLLNEISHLIGCTSFHSTDVGHFAPAFALLQARHVGPPDLRPTAKAPETISFQALAISPSPQAASLLPPLLRAYLNMGGWVSDHAVIDRDLGTSHVFTCVEVAKMSPQRKRVFSRLADIA